ncbi:cytochrome P450 [Aspergillus spectabilis]
MEIQICILASLAAITAGAYVLFASRQRPPSSSLAKLPLLNKRKATDIFGYRQKLNFFATAPALMSEGLRQSPAGFRIMTAYGEDVVLPPQFADELRRDSRLDAMKAAELEFLVHVPTLRPLSGGTVAEQILLSAIARITRALGKLIALDVITMAQALIHLISRVKGDLTEPVSGELNHALEREWTSVHKDWHAVPLASTLARIITQAASRVFAGPVLCRDPRWVDAMVSFSSSALRSATILKFFPRILHRPLELFLPSCRKTRGHSRAARALIEPVLAENKKKAESQAPGTRQETPKDATVWLEEAAAGRYYDPLEAQLSLIFSASHTTADFIAKLLLRLCENSELITALREEVIATVGKGGAVSKEDISNLKLMDSVMKETHRMSPTLSATMGRYVTDDMTLSTGLNLPAGTRVWVANTATREPEVYPDPTRFDGRRYLRMREALAPSGKENLAQWVATDPHNLAFGHGVHACPGRFFANYMVKILLCHLLLKYDFKLAAGLDAERRVPFGFIVVTDPATKLLIRRRESSDLM